MKKAAVLVIGLLLVFCIAGAVVASQPIKIIVNGTVIETDVQPQIILGRTMVPLRAVADALGATVKWDAVNRTVVIKSPYVATAPTEKPKEDAAGLTRTNPVPIGQSFLTPDGFVITVQKVIKGNDAWKAVRDANEWNDPPTATNQYVLVTCNISNVSSEEDSVYVTDTNVAVVGKANKMYKSFEQSIMLPNEGPASELAATLYHGGQTTGTFHFHVPENESEMILVWNPVTGPTCYFKLY